MGLDSNIYSIPHKDTNTPTDMSFEGIDPFEIHDIGYWRKANHIHGHMESIYRDKGGTDPEFNCVKVQLTSCDLKRLLMLVITKKLEPVPGFFFGGNNIPEDIDTHTIRIICNGLNAIDEGKDVYFSSWY